MLPCPRPILVRSHIIPDDIAEHKSVAWTWDVSPNVLLDDKPAEVRGRETEPPT